MLIHNIPLVLILPSFLLTMAWISSGTTNDSLVMNLQHNGIIKSPMVTTKMIRSFTLMYRNRMTKQYLQVAQAMKAVDRADYTLSGMPYQDNPNPIGHDQTISAPHMHAQALEASLLKIMHYFLTIIIIISFYRISMRRHHFQMLRSLTLDQEVATCQRVLLI